MSTLGLNKIMSFIHSTQGDRRSSPSRGGSRRSTSVARRGGHVVVPPRERYADALEAGAPAVSWGHVPVRARRSGYPGNGFDVI